MQRGLLDFIVQYFQDVNSFNVILTKTLAGIFVESIKLLKVQWKCKGFRIAKLFSFEKGRNMEDRHYLILRLVLKLAFFQNANIPDALPQTLVLNSCEPETWRHLCPFRDLLSRSFLLQIYTPGFPYIKYCSSTACPQIVLFLLLLFFHSGKANKHDRFLQVQVDRQVGGIYAQICPLQGNCNQLFGFRLLKSIVPRS